MNHIAMSFFFQLIVGRSCNYFRLQKRDRVVVDDGSQGAWRENIAVHAENFVHAYCFGAKIVDSAVYVFFIDVGNNQVCAFFVQMAAEVVGYVPHALNRYYAARQVVAAIRELGSGFHPAVHAVGSHRRRVAAGAKGWRYACYIISLKVDHIHIGNSRTYVFGCNVAAIQALNVTAKGTEQLFALVFARIADDDRFSAADVQAAFPAFL